MCGLVVTRSGGHSTRETHPSTAPSASVGPSTRRVLGWDALAFLPSSLMLAVTAHLSTDVAAIPLLWVVPLAIYLATFVGAFARSSRSTPLGATRLATAMAFVSALLVVADVHLPVLLSISVHLGTLAAVGYAAHARLAVSRPEPDHRTGFYVVVAVGGAVGGVLNGLVAPLMFKPGVGVRLHPGGRAAAPGGSDQRPRCRPPALSPRLPRGGRVRPARAAGRRPGLGGVRPRRLVDGIGRRRPRGVRHRGLGAHPGSPAPAAFLALDLLAVGLHDQSTAVATERTFFGSYQVLDRPGERVLTHGTTKHGVQLTAPGLRGEPTTYYARTGPLGAVFDAFDHDDVGVVGLGAGTMAAYGEPGQHMTFFEIDEEIAAVAADPRMFSFIEDSEAEIDVQVGDGRLLVDEQPAGAYDLVVLDAFSSDSIPVHLLPREAIRGFADRVNADGALVVHVSNQVFDLEPVLAAAEEDLGWSGVIGQGGSGVGATQSRWVVLTRDEAASASLRHREGWRALDRSRIIRWTDDYSSILAVLD
jgi:hypothetical protein